MGSNPDYAKFSNWFMTILALDGLVPDMIIIVTNRWPFVSCIEVNIAKALA